MSIHSISKHIFLTLLALVTLARAVAEEKSPPVPNADYRISPRDTIDFKIYNQPDMTAAQRVTASGEIRLPLIGTVVLAGTTLREAEILLQKRYRDGGYFIDPQVILAVQKYGERFVAVLGQVKNPDRVPLAPETNSIGILQAITQAGGFTRVARIDAVQVLRTDHAGQDARLTVNMEEILHPKNGSTTQEFQLRPGDTVFVPERAF